MAGHRICTCRRTRSQLVSAILRESLAQKSPVEQRHHRVWVSEQMISPCHNHSQCHRLTTLGAPACEPASCCRTMSICTKRKLSYTYLKLNTSSYFSQSSERVIQKQTTKLIKCENVRNVKENYLQLTTLPYRCTISLFHRVPCSSMMCAVLY